MIRIIFNTSVFILFSIICCNAQVDYTKQHIGIDASKFVLIFNEQVEILDITYRITAIDSTHSLRLSSSFNLSSEESAVTDFSVRVGIDKNFKTSGNWKFYTGLDVDYGRTVAKSAQRTTIRVGVIPFIGFLYNFGTHFSLSTEPSFALFRTNIVDENTFIPNSEKSSISLNLINIGQIKIGFHF